jgi:hypothetical protein
VGRVDAACEIGIAGEHGKGAFWAIGARPGGLFTQPAKGEGASLFCATELAQDLDEIGQGLEADAASRGPLHEVIPTSREGQRLLEVPRNERDAELVCERSHLGSLSRNDAFRKKMP